MTRWLIPTLFASFPLILPAATTVAWKIPVKSVMYDFPSNPAVRKLDQPPIASPFFQSGDVLWDISKTFADKWHAPVSSSRQADDPNAPAPLPPIQSAWTGEFIVWDERSGQIVARGEENEIAALENVLGFRDFPTAFSAKIELIDRRTPLTPSRSLTLLAKNEEVASVKDGDFEITLRTADVYLPLKEVELTANWQTDDKVPCEVEASATVRDGIPFRFVRRGDEEIVATVTQVMPDGTPYLAARFREVDGEIRPWPEEREAPVLPRETVGENLFIGWFQMGVPASLGIEQKDLKEVVAPKEWQNRIRGHLLDLSTGLAEKGVSGLRFAGYDPVVGMTVVVGSEMDMDLVEAFLTPFRCFLGKQIIWAESTSEDTSQPALGISCAVGHQANMTGGSTADQGDFEFSIDAPDDAEHYSRNLLELHYTDHHDPVHPADLSLSTALTLWEESPVVIGRFEDGGQPSRSRNFTTTLFFY